MFWGRLCCFKTIIPDSQEHPLAASGHCPDALLRWIRVKGEGGERREVHAVVGSGGSFGASSIEQEIGLGRADRMVSLEIWWPSSGTVQTFDDVPLDAHVEVREDSDRFTLRDVPTFSFDRLRASQ